MITQRTFQVIIRTEFLEGTDPSDVMSAVQDLLTPYILQRNLATRRNEGYTIVETETSELDFADTRPQ